MLELEENKRFLNNLKGKLDNISESMKIGSLNVELEQLKQESMQENFWQDTEKSSKIYSKMKTLEKKINLYESLKKELSNLLDMNDLLEVEFEDEFLNELLRDSKSLSDKLDNLEIQTLFSGKYDSNNAIITLHPGAGGTESQDWAEMLYRMYRKMGISKWVYIKRT